MKIIPNIPGFAKLLYCLRYFNPYKKAIEAAKAAGDDEEERRQILAATSSFGPMIMKMFNCRLTVEGLDNLPEKGPVVLVGNHQGYADIAAYFAAFRKFQFAFVAKEELARIPFYGPWMARIRSVFIPRGEAKASLEAIREGVALLERGFSLVIFPEGTRSQSSEPGPFMKGAFKLATRAKVPIVPVSLDGTYNMFEATGVIQPADIRMIVHEPIPTAGLSRQEEKELPERVEKIVTDGVRLLAGKAAGEDAAEQNAETDNSNDKEEKENSNDKEETL